MQTSIGFVTLQAVDYSPHHATPSSNGLASASATLMDTLDDLLDSLTAEGTDDQQHLAAADSVVADQQPDGSQADHDTPQEAPEDVSKSWTMEHITDPVVWKPHTGIEVEVCTFAVS